MTLHSKWSALHAPLVGFCLALLPGCSPSDAEAQARSVQTPAAAPGRTSAAPPAKSAAVTLVPGDPFPAASYADLNGGGIVDLGDYLGKKPVLLYYWIAGNPRSEGLFRELSELVAEVGAERLALFGVAVPRPGLEADKIAARIAEIGLQYPVLDDGDFAVGKLLQVRSVPNLTLIDGEGRLRLTNGVSLKQVLGYQLDLAGAIRKLGETGKLMTYGVLDRYYPVKELEGSACPDFTATQVTDSVERRLHGMLDSEGINALIFWSVDCPHCREELPAINAWLKENPGQVNVVSAASVSSEATKIKTREFCQANGFVFPTLMDQDAAIGERFQITSTPTILFIGPDRTIVSTSVSSHMSFSRAIQETRQRLAAGRGQS